MIHQLPPPTADRAVPAAQMTDRAVAGPDQIDRNAVSNSIQEILGLPAEPLNRRGRRAFQSAVRRSERQAFRSIVRQQVAERAGR